MRRKFLLSRGEYDHAQTIPCIGDPCFIGREHFVHRKRRPGSPLAPRRKMELRLLFLLLRHLLYQYLRRMHFRVLSERNHDGFHSALRPSNASPSRSPCRAADQSLAAGADGNHSSSSSIVAGGKRPVPVRVFAESLVRYAQMFKGFSKSRMAPAIMVHRGDSSWPLEKQKPFGMEI
jgi:hypothetical protein